MVTTYPGWRKRAKPQGRAVSIKDKLLRKVDRWLASAPPARRRRLLRELAKLDPAEERGLAEEPLRDETRRPLR